MQPWKLVYEHWSPDQQRLREALCVLGNGYFATRGAAEESRAGDAHYPGTYLAGGYDRADTEISGRVVTNEDLVNWPNWLCLSFRPEGGPWLDLDAMDVLDFRQELDLARGVLERRLRVRDKDGRITGLRTRRIVHMRERHLAAIEWELTPENWDGRLEVQSGIDGRIINDGVPRYRKLTSRHLETVGHGQVGEEGIWLSARTLQSDIRMTQAARTQVFAEESHMVLERRTLREPGYIAQSLSMQVKRGRTLRVEKVAALYTSRDHAISEPTLEARKAAERTERFAVLLASHERAWQQMWARADIEIDDGERSQSILRLHIFHLLQTVSMHSIDLDVGVPARGLHGEAYRGHIFWDELFIFPFLNSSMPELTRSLLMYRYRRLLEARRAAADEGHAGAMFPWQSGSNGREESQVLHLNPKSGRWLPDHTYRQRHVNGAIAYDVWQYYQATQDLEFLSFYGAEMVLSISKFWSSLATFSAKRGRYEIHEVVGPDEYHDGYPDSDMPGLNNNAYTNVMAVWTLRCALEIVDLLVDYRRRELLADLGIDDGELARWHDIIRRMYVPFHDDGIISQFEGYERLQEFDWEGYAAKHGNIQRLDRILEAEGDSPNWYKAGKQADVLMLFYLFSTEELRSLFEGMGYDFDPEIIPRNIDYYTRRTSHGSTLSRIVHSWVLARSDRAASWEHFQTALRSDVEDIQGGTTPEGIHLGAMSGTVDIVQRCFGGVELREDVLWLNPRLPDNLQRIRFVMLYRGRWLNLDFRHDRCCVQLQPGGARCVRIGFQDRVHEVREGEMREFSMEG